MENKQKETMKEMFLVIWCLKEVWELHQPVCVLNHQCFTINHPQSTTNTRRFPHLPRTEHPGHEQNSEKKSSSCETIGASTICSCILTLWMPFVFWTIVRPCSRLNFQVLQTFKAGCCHSTFCVSILHVKLRKMPCMLISFDSVTYKAMCQTWVKIQDVPLLFVWVSLKDWYNENTAAEKLKVPVHD